MKARRIVGVVLGITAWAALALPFGPPAAGGDDKAKVRSSDKITQSARHTCKWIKATEAQWILNKLVDNAGFDMEIDERSNTLHLRGPAESIEKAKVILARIDTNPGKEPLICISPILKVHAVPPGQAEPLARKLQELYRTSSLRISAAGNRVLVYGTPYDQEAIARHIQVALPRTVEVLPLTALEALPTVDLLKALFTEGGGPTLAADPSRNAILVRGFKEQIDEVRAALKALGESPPTGGVRVITLEQGNAATLARELQRVLSEMRSNPVRIVEPLGEPGAGKKPAPPAKGGPAAKKPAGPPVTLTSVGNKLVVTCDDPQVLAIVQELVRLVLRSQAGNLRVIQLRNASAVEVARILEQTLNDRTGSRRSERVRIVADPNSNSLLVRASPLDLITIKGLLDKGLDVPTPRDEGGPRTYVLGPLRHARAADLVKVLRDLYRDGGQPAVTITTDPRTNTLILRGPIAVHEDARKLVERLDVEGAKKE
jgi:type II secretory pathway component GspD/PulD (secretin)